MNEVVVGIDPGKSTGFAVYSVDWERLIVLETLDFWGAYDRAMGFVRTVPTMVIIEVPNSKHVWHKGAASERALQRQGANVGSVVREAELLAEGLARENCIVKRVQPRKKVNAKDFATITGWTNRSNQHERDAAMMCFGRVYRA